MKLKYLPFMLLMLVMFTECGIHGPDVIEKDDFWNDVYDAQKMKVFSCGYWEDEGLLVNFFKEFGQSFAKSFLVYEFYTRKDWQLCLDSINYTPCQNNVDLLYSALAINMGLYCNPKSAIMWDSHHPLQGQLYR